MNHLGLYTVHDLSQLNAATATECEKKQRGDAGYWTSEYMYPRVKIKLLSKVVAHENRWTNFWDTM